MRYLREEPASVWGHHFNPDKTLGIIRKHLISLNKPYVLDHGQGESDDHPGNQPPHRPVS